MFRTHKLVALLAILLASAQLHAQSTSPIQQRLLLSTGVVIVSLENNNYTVGTCWIADVQQRLIVTNQHVVGDKKQADLFFPLYQKGRLATENAYYEKFGKGITAKVLAVDKTRDLALLQANRLPAGMKSFPLADDSPSEGTPVFGLGNSPAITDHKLWKFTNGEAKNAKYRIVTLEHNQVVEARILEASAALKPGDSGGPLVDQNGKLVAVAFSISNGKSLFIDVSEVRTFLSRPKVKVDRDNILKGTWQIKSLSPDRVIGFRLTFAADGTCIYEGEKKLAATFSLTKNKLRLIIPDLRSDEVFDLTWQGDGRFTFVSANMEFAATRR